MMRSYKFALIPILLNSKLFIHRHDIDTLSYMDNSVAISETAPNVMEDSHQPARNHIEVVNWQWFNIAITH